MPNDMFTFDPEMTNLVMTYCRERLAMDPAPLDYTGNQDTLDGVLKGLINENGSNLELVLKAFEDTLAQSIISIDSPRFLSFIPTAPTKASLLFDMIVSASSLNGTSWLEASGAVAAENQVIAFLAKAAGLPNSAGGVFVSGGTIGNLSSLVVARDQARIRYPELQNQRLRFAVSAEAHSSIASALSIIDCDTLIIPTEDHRMTLAALKETLKNDPNPQTVICIVATAGTTNAGIVDELEGIGEFARSTGKWFHIDGAYGAAAMLSSERKQLFTGMRHADSFIVDPHKWLFTPFDCAAVIYRDPEKAATSHTQNAAYLDVLHEESTEWNPSDYAIGLTRRARGLPFWFSLCVNGTKAYSEAIDYSILLAERTVEIIDSLEHVEMVRQTELSIVLFRRIGWKEDDYYQWSQKLLTEQMGFVVPTKFEGETISRFAFLHPHTTEEMVVEILDSMS